MKIPMERVQAATNADPDSEAPGGHYELLQRYLVPRLEVRPPASPDDAEEVVVHLRSGDVLGLKLITPSRPGGATNQVEMAMAPCIFYARALQRFSGVSRVRIVTEADRSHPCIDAIRAASPDKLVVVQSGSREEDAAAIIYATYFVPSASWFGYTLINLNTRLRKLVYFDSRTPGRWNGHYRYPCRPGVAIERATIAGYRIFEPPGPTTSDQGGIPRTRSLRLNSSFQRVEMRRWLVAPHHAEPRFDADCHAKRYGGDCRGALFG